MIYETFISCSSACAIQSSLLYWIKPIIKNQHIYGDSLLKTYTILSSDKDIFRFYRGFVPHIIKSGIGRTADITLYKKLSTTIDNNKYTSLISGGCSSIIKIATMPLDTVSNIYQVHGKYGINYINGNLYRGTVAYGLTHGLSTSIWLYSYNYLKNDNHFSNNNLNHIYNGFFSSFITDIIVNPLRVIKTNKQVLNTKNTYHNILTNLKGQFYRGFKTRLFYNGINSSLFVLLWQNLEDKFMVDNK